MMYIPVKCPFNICQNGFVPCDKCFYKVVPVVNVLLDNRKNVVSVIDDPLDVVNIRPDFSEF